MKRQNFRQIADDIIKRLNKHNLGAFLWAHAKTGSCYIRFADSRMCSIRIGDHDGRERYKYKFNLRSDITTRRVEVDDGTERFYFPINDVDGLILTVLERKKLVDKWRGVAKYKGYNIPSHKKQHNVQSDNQKS